MIARSERAEGYWPSAIDTLVILAGLLSCATLFSAVAVSFRLKAPAPSGMRRSIPVRSFSRLSGRSLAKNFVLTAIMPQPISTPTAAGMMASLVAMTEPTVAPLPRWQSGMTAICLNIKGSSEMFRSCCFADGSIVSLGRNVTTLSFSLSIAEL